MSTDQGRADARERELAQISGITLGEGRRGHKAYIRVRRQARALGPGYWRGNRAAEAAAAEANFWAGSQSPDWDEGEL